MSEPFTETLHAASEPGWPHAVGHRFAKKLFGKSHLAIAIARACIRGGARGRFYTVVDLINRLENKARAARTASPNISPAWTSLFSMSSAISPSLKPAANCSFTEAQPPTTWSGCVETHPGRESGSDTAQSLITDAGLTVGRVSYYNGCIDPGDVSAQTPRRGSMAPVGSSVDITISTCTSRGCGGGRPILPK
jgi:hypothetical protein